MKVTVSFDQALDTAFKYQRRGLLQEAEAVLRKLVQVKPGHEVANDTLMLVLYRQDRFDEAMAMYHEAIRRGAYPCDPVYDALYARALVATQNCPSPLKRRARFRNLVDWVSRTLDLDGCTAECGCYRGMSSHLILSRLRLHDPAFAGRGHHVFDSFQGLSAPTVEDEVNDDDPNADSIRLMSQPGSFRASLAEVKQALAEFPEVEYHPGWIPLSFGGLPERKYRFVHLDVDLYDPTLAALEHFYPRLSRQGVIVCDDYGWPGARKAIEEFCAEGGISFSATEHQQAVLVQA